MRVSRADELHQQAQSRLRAAARRLVAALVLAVPLDDVAMARDFPVAVSRVVAGGQWQAARLALAYIRAHVAPLRPPNLAAALEDVLVTPESAHALAGLEQLRQLLEQGVDEPVARQTAGFQAGNIASTDVQAASRAGLDEAARAAGRPEVMWRLQPGPSACEWCTFIAGTGARYLSAESVLIPHSPVNPIHPGGPCGCEAAPAF